MDAAQVFAECLLVLGGIRLQVATIQLGPGAEEPSVGMGCPNVTAGSLFVGELHATFLCQTMIVLNGGATLCRLEVLHSGYRAGGMSHLLIKLARCLWPALEMGSYIQNNLVKGAMSLLATHCVGFWIPSWKLREGENLTRPTLELSEELLYPSVSNVESPSVAERHSAGRAKGCRNSGVMQSGARAPTWLPELWGIASPDFPSGLVVTPVIAASSVSGTLMS